MFVNPTIICFDFCVLFWLSIRVMDDNEEFIKEIFNYFIDDLSKYSSNHIVKKHTEKLHEYGDYSFPTNIQNWTQFLSPNHKHSCDNIFSYRELRSDFKFQSITDHCQHLIDTSQKWTLRIQIATFKNSRCLIFLNRHAAFYSTINAVLNNSDYGCQVDDRSYGIDIVKNNVIPAEQELLTKYRCRIVSNAIENLMQYSRTKNNVQSSCLLYVTHKSTDVDAPVDATCILIGNVTNSDNKVLNVTADEYIK